MVVQLAQYEKVAADHPGVPAYLRKLASSHSNLGVGLIAGGNKQFREAERHFGEGLKIWDPLRADFPGQIADRAGLAHLYHWMSNLRGASVPCAGPRARGVLVMR